MEQGAEPPLLHTLLTAIPKKDKPTDVPSNLRPISVTSIWYRLIMRIFTNRLHGLLPHFFSVDQHGFCPDRNVGTALLTVLPVVDFARSAKRSTFLMQLDIDKAYDSVDR